MVASQGTTQWAGEGVPAGAKRLADRLRGIRDPLGDRGHGPRAGQHRGSGHGHDGDQRVTAATLGAWVGDGRQVGQQVTGLGHLQRDASASWVRADGIGDDSSAGTSVHGGHQGVVAHDRGHSRLSSAIPHYVTNQST